MAIPESWMGTLRGPRARTPHTSLQVSQHIVLKAMPERLTRNVRRPVNYQPPTTH